MASQSFDPYLNYFRCDVHGCSISLALDVVSSRIEDCHRYGIPFLEIIHGANEEAEDRGKRTIRAAIANPSMKHKYVRKKISIDGHGYRLDKYRQAGHSTAHRLCLTHNPSPAVRSPDVQFRGFVPEYETVPVSSYQPFCPRSVTYEEVADRLFGNPQEPHGPRDYVEHYKSLRRCVTEERVCELLDKFGRMAPMNPSDRLASKKWLLADTDFIALRSHLLESSLAKHELALLGQFPVDWIDWCQAFNGDDARRVAHSCKCFVQLLEPLQIGAVDEDGDFELQKCYRYDPCAVNGFRELWNRCGSFSLRPDADGTYWSSICRARRSFCTGRECECKSSDGCKDRQVIAQQSIIDDTGKVLAMIGKFAFGMGALAVEAAWKAAPKILHATGATISNIADSIEKRTEGKSG